MNINRSPWQSLSIRDKNDIIKVAVSHGITNLSDIRDAYNSFAGGGDLYPDAVNFRKNYKLDTSGDYYSYVPRR